MSKQNDNSPAQFPKRIAIALGVVALLFLALRFVALDNDPPLYFVKHGQSLLTDPYHLTHHARQHALFDNSNLFEIHRWDNFKNSMVSAVAYVTFAVAGVSRSSANFAAALLSVCGILLFSLGIYRRRGQKEALLTVLLLSVNNLLFFYGRVPLLENGLIFLSGSLFYVYITYGKSIAGQIVCGALVAIAALAGKVFGALLIAPLIGALIYEYRSKALMPSLYVIAGAVGGAALYALVFYGGDMSRVFSYYLEQTTGMYGSPPGLASPLNFLKMLFTYGGESGMIQYQPLWFSLAGLALIFATLVAPSKLKNDESFAPIVFCALWLLVGIAGLSPFFYRPLRYGLFLTLPAGALSAFLLAQLLSSRIRLQSFARWVGPAIVFVVLWYLIVQAVMYLGPEQGKFAAGVGVMLKSGIFAAGLAALLGWFFNRARSFKLKPFGWIALGLIVAVMAVNQGSYLYRGLFKAGKALQGYNHDLAEIIPENAVITGPYAPALTIDNSLKSVIYMFGLSNVDSSLFDDYPITHIAVEPSNWRVALKDFPKLKHSQIVTEMVVRDQGIRLYRISDSTFPKTDFEMSAELLNRNQPDSALVFVNRFLEKYPGNLFARMGQITATLGKGDTKSSPALLKKLTNDFPENYFALAYAMGMYRRLAGLTQSRSYLQIAETLRLRVEELNPYMPTGKISKVGS